MSINSSGKKLEGFFTGKGFYIVLFLCAAVIGLSAWMMAAGNKTMENLNELSDINIGSSRVETVVIPPQSESEDLTPVIKPIPDFEETEPVIADGETSQVWNGDGASAVESPLYIWPVMGELERGHDLENLSYDVTLKDWRTHDGVDISAPLGTSVAAACSGSVIALEEDSLYGTVVSIDHGDGLISVYANLAALPTVTVGDWLEAGDIIGSVGTTALCEIGQGTHLHFAMKLDGASVNPLDYLPA
ncbi:MAG: M23 family metallopeptidase [Oscillospiraceae bacterium]|nr:M23 family metallopeptidase [Oscillospiraceae bacterium]